MKVLEHLEFEFVRQVGSHMRYAKGKRRVTVAKYSWYSHDVFSFMMDQIGISKKYFFEVLDEIGR
ncbi:MAG: type II toxin-antitoxin system HicA family toxin [Nitrosopumilus sp.]|nr:type II toxin-antitoxin system HicA family toxin [Nitrosopumilus sp.]